MECFGLYPTYIGQGTTVCMLIDCKRNHRTKKMDVLPGQLFVAKSKEVVFAGPTVEFFIKPELLQQWKDEACTVSVWKEKFKQVKQVVTDSKPVGRDTFVKEEWKSINAREFKTPAKRIVRETLEEDEVDRYMGLGPVEDFTLETEKDCILRIDKVLDQNQRKHNKFRGCHVKLEDNIKEISYASEYKSKLLDQRIGKRPKLLDNKFNGAYLYTVIGAVASKVNYASERGWKFFVRLKNGIIKFQEDVSS